MNESSTNPYLPPKASTLTGDGSRFERFVFYNATGMNTRNALLFSGVLVANALFGTEFFSPTGRI